MDPTTGHQFPKTNINPIGKAVLVTGGAGYVGSHTCKLLVKNGFVPVTVGVALIVGCNWVDIRWSEMA